MLICLYEDRAPSIVAVRLAVLSLKRHAPEQQIHVTLPGASREVRAWFERFDGVQTTDEPLPDTGWDVKPSLLLRRLDEGHPVVAWWDTDIVCSADPRPLFGPHGPEVLVSTQETYWGQEQTGGHRTRAWGLPAGRTLATTVNSSVVRVSPSHRPVLERWAQMLAAPAYQDARRNRHVASPPLHLLGDQEVLTAVLGSAEFEDVPLHLLRRGADIAQCFGPAGFTVRERLALLARRRAAPPLLHATTPKPWIALADGQGGPRGKRERYERLHCELSPYTVAARAYRSDVGPDDAWLDHETPLGRALRRLPGDPAIVPELPVAVFDSVVRRARRRLQIGRFELS